MIFLWDGSLLKLMEIGCISVLQISYTKDVAGLTMLRALVFEAFRKRRAPLCP
jgi:hypothetical protein